MKVQYSLITIESVELVMYTSINRIEYLKTYNIFY